MNNSIVPMVILLFSYVVYTNLLYIRTYLIEKGKFKAATKLYMVALLAIFGITCIQLQSKLFFENYIGHEWLSFLFSLLLFGGYMFTVITLTKKLSNTSLGQYKIN